MRLFGSAVLVLVLLICHFPLVVTAQQAPAAPTASDGQTGTAVPAEPDTVEADATETDDAASTEDTAQQAREVPSGTVEQGNASETAQPGMADRDDPAGEDAAATDETQPRASSPAQEAQEVAQPAEQETSVGDDGKEAAPVNEVAEEATPVEGGSQQTAPVEDADTETAPDAQEEQSAQSNESATPSADAAETAAPVADAPATQTESTSQTEAETPVPVDASPEAPASAQVMPSDGQDDAAADEADKDVASDAAEKPTIIDMPPRPEDVTITIATWGGAYAQSQELAYFQPFSDQERYRFRVVFHDGSYDALKSQVKAGKVEWDLIDADEEIVDRACEEGMLERMDHSILTLAAQEAAALATEDFINGALKPCGVASVAWSAVMVYDTRIFRKRKPKAIGDFFNIRAYPGKRALLKGARYTLELALLADGVEPAEVYGMLATQEGQDRAFAKLSEIRDHIIWAERPADVLKLLSEEEAAIGLAFNGRAFMSIVGDRQPLRIVWDGQIYAFDYWAVPKGSANKRAALELIKFATQPERMAAQTRWFPYGPARKSALAFVGKHAEMNLDMAPFLPTHPDNFNRALAFDATWWREHEGPLAQRFADWLAGEPGEDEEEAKAEESAASDAAAAGSE